jgi:hypothetical protein
MPPQTIRKFGMAVALLSVAAFPLVAQERPMPPLPPKQGPGTLVGIVVDTMGRPVDSALVFIAMPRHETRTDIRGYFRLNGLGGLGGQARTIQFGIRKVGYMAQQLRVRLDSGGGTIRVELVPVVRTLATVRTEATRTGLYGIVTTTEGTPIPDARAHLMGSGAGTSHTDSSGFFNIPGKPGRYMLRVSRRGYLDALVSVALEETSGRNVEVKLRTGSQGMLARQADYMDRLRGRLVMRKASTSKLYTREDIERIKPNDLRHLVTMPGYGRVDESCEAIVDGGMDLIPMWALDLDALEFIEVYQKSPRGRPGMCPSQVYVWLRK